MSNSMCLNCGTSEQERPLLAIKFQKRKLFICPQCLPILIHKPYQLVAKLPAFVPPDNPAPDYH
jgi:hypothetical protein